MYDIYLRFVIVLHSVKGLRLCMAHIIYLALAGTRRKSNTTDVRLRESYII